jgi:hypothetical protein
LNKLVLPLSIVALLIFMVSVAPVRSKTTANITYTGGNLGYACIFDSNSTKLYCLAESQNFTLDFGNYTLTAFLYNASAATFSHWITQGNVTVRDIQGNNTLLEVNGDGNVAAVFLPAQKQTEGIVTFTGTQGFVCFLNYANASGPICLMDGQNTTLPVGRYVAEAAPHNASDSFVKWFTQGQITVDNQTSSITDVTVQGNGVLGLVYAPAVPTPEILPQVVPVTLVTCLIGALLLSKKRPNDKKSAKYVPCARSEHTEFCV